MHIGGRVIKTGAAVGLAVFVAQLFRLEPGTFAGVVALLSVQRSFYRSVHQSLKRIGSIVVGTSVGAIFAFTFGHSPVTVVFVTIIVILLCLRLNWQDSIVLGTVTAVSSMTFYSEIFFTYAGRQMLLALIGVSCALSVNYLFMPCHKNEVEGKLEIIERRLGKLLWFVYEELIRIRGQNINSKEFEDQVCELHRQIKEGVSLVKLLREEQRYKFLDTTPSEQYLTAFQIFSSGTDRVLGMYHLAEKIKVDVPQIYPIAKLLRILVRVQQRIFYGRHVPHFLLKKAIISLEDKFEEMQLPQTRAEFVARAALLHIFGEAKEYYKKISKLPTITGRCSKG